MPEVVGIYCVQAVDKLRTHFAQLKKLIHSRFGLIFGGVQKPLTYTHFDWLFDTASRSFYTPFVLQAIEAKADLFTQSPTPTTMTTFYKKKG